MLAISLHPLPPAISASAPASSLPSLEVGPLNPAKGFGGSALSSPAGSGAEPQPKLNLVHFSFKIAHLVATISMIFLRINLQNFVQFSLIGRTLLYHRSPLSWYHLGERRSPKKYLGDRRSPSTTQLTLRALHTWWIDYASTHEELTKHRLMHSIMIFSLLRKEGIAIYVTGCTVAMMMMALN